MLKKKIAILLVLLSILYCIQVSASQKNIDAVTAPKYMLIDCANQSVMLQKNGNDSIAINNFSKIMTAVLVIEKKNMPKSVAFTEENNVFNGSFGNIAMTKPGQSYTVNQHLHNMLLLYSDASAIALSEAHSGSEAAFVQAMNKKAKEIGMENTVFTSPDGKKNAKGKTTMQDLFKLYAHAMDLPLFKEITGTVQFELPDTNGKPALFSSRNHLLSRYTYASYTYSPAVSGFVSFDDTKKGSMIVFAEQSGKEICGIVIGTPGDGTEVYTDAINLLEYGYNDFTTVVVAKKGTFLKQVPVTGAMATHAVLVAEKDISVLLPVKYDEEKLTTKMEVPVSLEAPLTKNAAYGTVTYYYDGNALASCPLVAEKDIEDSFFSFFYRLFSGVNTWFILLILVAFIVFISRYQKKRRQKEARRARKKAIMEENE